MSKTNHLFRRDGRYYFRARLPAEIVRELGKKELKRSLGTKSLTEAIKRSRPLEALISQLRIMSDSEKILRQLRDAGLSPDKLTHKIGSISKAGYVLRDIDVDPASPEEVEALLKVIDRIGAADEERLTKAPASSISLSEAIDRYISHYSTTDCPEMLSRIKVVMRTLFIAIVGDKPINEINKIDLITFFDQVQKLPRQWQSKYAKGLSISQIIKDNDGLPGLSENTVKTPYKAALTGFLGWGHSQLKDYGFPHLELTKHDITYRGNKRKGDGSQRSFRLDELKVLFEGPEFHKLANSSRHIHKYWLLLIALYTGARIREICQLHPVTDIRDIEGVQCFCITEEIDPAELAIADPEVIKQLKTKGSERNVPIHPLLISMGFLEYVKCLREAGARRIFPLFSVKDGDAGANPGKWFINLLKSLNLRDETLGKKLSGHHAFRSTFITYAHNHDIANYWEITGHDDKDIPDTVKLYRGPKDAPKLLELISKFKFDLDIPHPVSLNPKELKRLIAQQRAMKESGSD